MISRLIPIALTLLLAGCDNVAALLADPKAIQREADAKAIGGACRYAMRSIEDCYTLNEKASKSLVFQGWKDMDQYMRDNKIDGVPSTVAKPVAPAPAEEIIEEDKAKPKTGAKAA